MKKYKIEQWYNQLPQIVRYFLISCTSMVIDVILVWVLYRKSGVAIVTANTVGVVCGFIVSYKLSTRFVFHVDREGASFIIFFGTFLVGLVLADSLIYWGETSLFAKLSPDIGFLFSKGLSIVLPFFVLYYLRRWLYATFEKGAVFDRKVKKE